MSNKILTTLIGLAVAIVCIATVLMPALSDASTDERTGTNPYYFRMSEIGDETITLSYDADNSKPLYNGELTDFTTSNDTEATSVAIISDTFIINTTGGLWYYYFISGGADQQIYSTATGANTAVATIGNGVMNLYINESLSFDVPYTTCYIPDNSGKFVMCQEHFNGLVSKSTDIMATITLRTNHGVATGPIDDLTTTFHATDGTVDTDSYAFEMVYDTETVGITELYKTKYDTFRYILPYEYHYLEENEYASLYSVIPVLVIVGILLAAISLILVRRD